jgi:hypothetical protein
MSVFLMGLLLDKYRSSLDTLSIILEAQKDIIDDREWVSAYLLNHQADNSTRVLYVPRSTQIQSTKLLKLLQLI